MCQLYPDPDGHQHVDCNADADGDPYSDDYPDPHADGDGHRDADRRPARLLSGVERLRAAYRGTVRRGKYSGVRRLVQRLHRSMRCLHADRYTDTDRHTDVHAHGDTHDDEHKPSGGDGHGDPNPGPTRLLSGAKRVWPTQQRTMPRRQRAGVWRLL